MRRRDPWPRVENVGIGSDVRELVEHALLAVIVGISVSAQIVGLITITRWLLELV